MKYSELPLIEPIQKAIEEAGYKEPTPIQEQAIPLILKGNDILGCAQTGTGKTAAFTLPILQQLANNDPYSKGIKALIITPTRELAIQIDECITTYNKYLNLKHVVIFGGVGAQKQINAIKEGAQIIVATPGRLLDLQNQGYIHLKTLKFFVLDEADRMLDMGFIHDIRKILRLIPAKRQTLFFSATMPDSISNLSKQILANPKRIDISPVSSTVEEVEQSLYFVEKNNKRKLLIHLLQENNWKSILVFSRTKHGADKIAKTLNKENINTAVIHGNKSQNARQRALLGFKKNEIRVLIATDIAARGIDIDKLSLVINFDVPNVPETYVHRIGRTGRAGQEGEAITFCDREEIKDIKSIERLIQLHLTREKDFPFAENYNFQTQAKPEKKKQDTVSQEKSARKYYKKSPRRKY